MKIINILPFVKTNRGDIGIADAHGTFASSTWCISDEAFNSVSGQKFGWTAPDGGTYTDHRDLFSRPTEQEVIAGLSDRLKEKAVEMGLIEL